MQLKQNKTKTSMYAVGLLFTDVYSITRTEKVKG